MSQYPPAPPPPPGAPMPPPPYGGASSGTNGLAIASLVCGICGFLCIVPAVLGIVFGYRARRQIDESGGVQQGRGMATAGLVCGWVWVALTIVYIIVAIANS
jgi:hypothetical protein